jgi:hypothetical protein
MTGIDLFQRRTMDLPITLSLEQQFNLKVYEEQVRQMSAEQSQACLLQVMQQLMVKDNVVKHLMKKI